MNESQISGQLPSTSGESSQVVGDHDQNSAVTSRDLDCHIVHSAPGPDGTIKEQTEWCTKEIADKVITTLDGTRRNNDSRDAIAIYYPSNAKPFRAFDSVSGVRMKGFSSILKTARIGGSSTSETAQSQSVSSSQHEDQKQYHVKYKIGDMIEVDDCCTEKVAVDLNNMLCASNKTSNSKGRITITKEDGDGYEPYEDVSVSAGKRVKNTMAELRPGPPRILQRSQEPSEGLRNNPPDPEAFAYQVVLRARGTTVVDVWCKESTAGDLAQTIGEDPQVENSRTGITIFRPDSTRLAVMTKVSETTRRTLEDIGRDRTKFQDHPSSNTQGSGSHLPPTCESTARGFTSVAAREIDRKAIRELDEEHLIYRLKRT